MAKTASYVLNRAQMQALYSNFGRFVSIANDHLPTPNELRRTQRFIYQGAQAEMTEFFERINLKEVVDTLRTNALSSVKTEVPLPQPVPLTTRTVFDLLNRYQALLGDSIALVDQARDRQNTFLYFDLMYKNGQRFVLADIFTLLGQDNEVDRLVDRVDPHKLAQACTLIPPNTTI